MGEALCHKSRDGRLAYKKDGDDKGLLVYKSKYSNVYIFWGGNSKDLDICAYWLGYSGGKVGYRWGISASEGPYVLRWYGDSVSTGGSEKLLPAIVPWGSLTNHTLRVHFNFFDYGSTCGVRVTSSDGESRIEKTGIACGHREHSKADVQDPYVDIVFDNNGNAVSIT